ncbi:MAG: type I restriction enzyme HsdR N-terminal domain-containing protein [Actinobacteria bacterium]|nr:type I restriction enzyme HsdR N-terminal domain-containing protein [Actinomycetota bacterium]
MTTEEGTIAGAGRPDATETKPRAPRSGPKWENAAKERVKAGIRRFSKPLAELVARDANEGDTRLLVTDFLCEVLGYDKYTDLTTEYRVRGEFADFGLRVEKQLVAFVEVKRVTTKLGTKHLRQVQNYALNEGVEWVVLTNGAQWQVYHITAAVPVLTEIAFEVDILADGGPSDKAAKLFYLTQESLKRRQIDELWRARRATSPDSLANVLRSEKVVDAIRRELWRQTGHRATAEAIVDLLEQTVLRPECLGE